MARSMRTSIAPRGGGPQRLRRAAPRHAGDDQGSDQSDRGAAGMSNYDIILSPVITEKSTRLSEANQVIFRVTRSATKPEIAKAVEQLFKVKVKAVNTVRTKGKMKAFRGRRFQKSEVKKAIVTLVEGYQIDVTTGL